MVYTDSDRGFAFNFFEGTPRTFAWLAIGAGRTAVLLEDDFGVLDAPNSVHVISGAFEQNPGDAVPIWDVLPENNRHFAKRAYDGYGPPLFGTLGRAVQCVVKRRSKKES